MSDSANNKELLHKAVTDVEEVGGLKSVNTVTEVRGTEEFWGQRSEVFTRTSFSSPTDMEIRQEPASSGSSKRPEDSSHVKQ
ncbi:hypothetical protein F7725_016324 [Dissostichus mawsoni]|uniref:Uncharacterized protein n=1 Tax=Dissostichus mawsoni TaxID=36200 RepID=A0A7J5Z3A2_DISMA|nr:hypothetical protein F7725_016324 [Dissostichus mawsoni]